MCSLPYVFKIAASLDRSLETKEGVNKEADANDVVEKKNFIGSVFLTKNGQNTGHGSNGGWLVMKSRNEIEEWKQKNPLVWSETHEYL
jgi:hypothetical protein